MIKNIDFYDFERGYGWLKGKEKIKINKNDTTVLNRIIIALKTKIGLKFNSLNRIVGLEDILFINGAKCVCSETVHTDMQDFIKSKFHVSEVENLSLCYPRETIIKVAQELSTYKKINMNLDEYSEIRERVSMSKWHTEKYCCYPNWGYDKPLIKNVYEDIYNVSNNVYTTVYAHKGFETSSLKELEDLVGIKPTKCSHNHMDDMADSYNIID